MDSCGLLFSTKRAVNCNHRHCRRHLRVGASELEKSILSKPDPFTLAFSFQAKDFSGSTTMMVPYFICCLGMSLSVFAFNDVFIVSIL